MIWWFIACGGEATVEAPEPDVVASEEPSTLGEDVWVGFQGGPFEMGTAEPGGTNAERPVHTVTVGPFSLMKHEVRVRDYQACEAAGACPPRAKDCQAAGPDMPATCLTWEHARSFCAFVDGRLPTEAEWEYAARSGGQDIEYPWGNSPAPDCDHANVRYGLKASPSCYGAGLWEVCTHPKGNTTEGLCEMGGNAFEWVADWHDHDYSRHPTDGSAQTEAHTEFRSMRGGGVGSTEPVRTRARTFHPPDFQYGGMGARCARDE